MTQPLVLSLFPGIGLLDMAFEEEGFCIVRGPDVIWGGDVRRFHPPAGRFAGIIGGPPCQWFSSLRTLQIAQGREPRHGNLIPEFERIVDEARPPWFVMENVEAAPEPRIDGYHVQSAMLDNHWLGEEQGRARRISYGAGTFIDAVRATHAMLESVRHGALPARRGAVTSSDGGPSVRMSRYTLDEMLRLQGLPSDFLAESPFTSDGKRKAIANGVPLPMGRAIAKAVKRAMYPELCEASA